jgi:hypothetical protein
MQQDLIVVVVEIAIGISLPRPLHHHSRRMLGSLGSVGSLADLKKIKCACIQLPYIKERVLLRLMLNGKL